MPTIHPAWSGEPGESEARVCQKVEGGFCPRRSQRSGPVGGRVPHVDPGPLNRAQDPMGDLPREKWAQLADRLTTFRLIARKQRATYKAVAELGGVLPRGLMSGRPKTPINSWVVAASNGAESRRGSPTGYSVNQIHPDCYRQICAGDDNIIDSADVLRAWIRRPK
jgi:hypothetical protein